jgi:hypothetical protein
MTSYHQAVAAMYEGDARDLSAHDGQSQAAEYVNADTGSNGAEEKLSVKLRTTEHCKS